MKNIYFVLFYLCSLLATAQNGIIWQKTVGTALNDFPCHSAVSTDGYLIGGNSISGISGDKTEASKGGSDMWIVKLNLDGQIVWQKVIGGDLSDSISTIVKTVDGGYILGGSSYSSISGDKTENSRGQYDCWLVKIDAMGNIQWQRTIGGSFQDSIESLVQTSDGGYFLGCISNSNISGEKTENCRSIREVGNDYWVLKLNSVGAIEWQRTIGGNEIDDLKAVKQALDGGYIIGGHTRSGISGEKTEPSREVDYWILKLSTTGIIQWQRTLGGDSTELFSDLEVCEDGGFLVGGYSTSDTSGTKTENSKGEGDYWVVKLNSQGVIEWDKTIGGLGSDYLRSIKQKPNGHYVLSGDSGSGISGDKTENVYGSSDVWIVLLDQLGNVIGQKTLGGSEGEGGKNINILPDGNLLLTLFSQSSISGDKTENSRGLSDFWILKLNASILLAKESFVSSLKIFPNPTTQSVTLSFKNSFSGKVIQADILGKEIQSFQVNNTESFIMDIKGMPGIYILAVEENTGNKDNFKIIKI